MGYKYSQLSLKKNTPTNFILIGVNFSISILPTILNPSYKTEVLTMW